MPSARTTGGPRYARRRGGGLPAELRRLRLRQSERHLRRLSAAHPRPQVLLPALPSRDSELRRRRRPAATTRSGAHLLPASFRARQDGCHRPTRMRPSMRWLLPVAFGMLAVAAGCRGGTTTGSQGPGGSSAGQFGLQLSSSTLRRVAAAGSSTRSCCRHQPPDQALRHWHELQGGASSTGTSTGDRAPDFIVPGATCSAGPRSSLTLATHRPLAWMCPLPGTYFCESPGSCAQCLLRRRLRR